ncbi:TPA: hypothetical protein ACHK4P_004660, partial [Escherichia coli]
SIIAAHSFWSDIYTKSPFLGAMLVLSLPVIIIYLIYTWGSIRKSERLLDERVNDIRARQKKRKGGK